MIQLPKEQVIALLNYLLSRPCGEVEGAVHWLRVAIQQADEAAAKD